MSLPALDTLTGCLLVGTWASSLLYMFEISQIWSYFQNFKQDDWKFKTLVTTALVVDTLGMVGDYICVYLYIITHAGDAEYLFSMHWPMPLYVLDTGVLAVMVQAFLVFRYWCFQLIASKFQYPKHAHHSFLVFRNNHLGMQSVVSADCIIPKVPPVQFSGVLAGSLMATLYTSLADRLKFKIPIALWLVTELAVNAGIASVLLWEFRKARGILTETRRALDRLTAITIQSGAAAAMIAGATLIAYYIKPESNVAVGVSYPLRRVYVSTLLSNLNIRKSAKVFLYDNWHVFGSWDDRRRARAADIHLLGHR
ncbi:hypothetical protein MVEN_01130200 [Mycena venus]|uniref:DUF6534 domain-containing protein n=1 Tax=Mycena venus TaxID=2733690 RepID=A0A8H6Y9N6_9AGAR|nr:hypothetical protein MVEN_01130200 [Mycena venus]